MLILLLILTLLSPIKVNAAEIIVDENSWHTVEESEPEQPDLSDDLEYYDRNIAEYRVIGKEASLIQSRTFRAARYATSTVKNGVSMYFSIDGQGHYYFTDHSVSAGTDVYDGNILHYPDYINILSEHYKYIEEDAMYLDLIYYHFDNDMAWLVLMPDYVLDPDYGYSDYQTMNRRDIDIQDITNLYLLADNGSYSILRDGEDYTLFRGCSAEYIQTQTGGYTYVDNAFADCPNLKEVNITNCYLAPSSFENCAKLHKVTTYNLQFVPARCFKNCVNLEEVITPNTVTVREESFYNCPLFGTSSDRPMFGLAGTVGNKAFWLPEDTVISGEDVPLYTDCVKTYFKVGTKLNCSCFDYDWIGDNRAIYWHDKEPEIVYIDYKNDTVLQPDYKYLKQVSVACLGTFWIPSSNYNPEWTVKYNYYTTSYFNKYDCDISFDKADDKYIMTVSGEVHSQQTDLSGKIHSDQHNCNFSKDFEIVISDCPHENTHIETTAWCTRPGVESVICDDCGNVISRKDAPAMGHSYPDSWTIVKPATDTECGYKEKVCVHGDRCDQRACDDRANTLREPIPIIGSSMVYRPADTVDVDTSKDDEALKDIDIWSKQISLTEWQLHYQGRDIDKRSISGVWTTRSVSDKMIVCFYFTSFVSGAWYIETDYDWDDTDVRDALEREYATHGHSAVGGTHIYEVGNQLAFIDADGSKQPLGRHAGTSYIYVLRDADFTPFQFRYCMSLQEIFIANQKMAHAIPSYCFDDCDKLRNIYMNVHDISEVGQYGMSYMRRLEYFPSEHIKFMDSFSFIGFDTNYVKDLLSFPEVEIMRDDAMQNCSARKLEFNDNLIYIPCNLLRFSHYITEITPELSSLISIEGHAFDMLNELCIVKCPNLESVHEYAFNYAFNYGSYKPEYSIDFGSKVKFMGEHCLYVPAYYPTYVSSYINDIMLNYDWDSDYRRLEWCNNCDAEIINNRYFNNGEIAEDQVKGIVAVCEGTRLVNRRQVYDTTETSVIDDGSYVLTADTENNIDYALTATGDLHDHGYTATALTTKVADWTTNALEVRPNPITGPEDDTVSAYMEDAIVTFHIEALDGTNEDKGVEIPVQGLTGAVAPIQYGEHVQEFEYNGVKATATVIGTCIHKETEDVTTPPKCMGKGKVETTCKQCGEVIATKDIDPVGHDMPDTWTVIQEPTVDVFGLKVKVCQRGDDCDERTADNAPFTIYEVIPKLDKPAEEKLVKILINPDDITCDEGDKLIDHVKKVILVYEVTEPDGTKHERQEEVLPSDIPGLDKELATYGRDTLDITIGDVTGSAKVTVNCLHKEKLVTSTEATCAHGGFTNMVCKQCGYDFHVDEAVAPLGHDMPDEWTTVKIPTDTEKGLKNKVCKRGDACDERMDDGSPYTIFEEIPMLNDMAHTVHYYGEWEVIKEATCTADGLKEKKCDDPSCSNTLQDTIPKMGHDMADGVHVVEDDKGYTLHKCKRNDYEYKIPDITVKVKLKSDDSSKTKGKKVTLAGKEETTNDSGEVTFTLVSEGSKELEVADAGTVKFNVTKDGAKNVKKKAKNDATISTSFKDEVLTVNVNLDKKKEEKKDDGKKKEEENSQTQPSSSEQWTQEQPVTNINDMLNWIQNTTGLPSVLPQTGQDNVSGNDKQVIIGGLPVNKSTLLFGVVILCGVVVFLIKRKR